MSHENGELFTEPTGEDTRAGIDHWLQYASPYVKFMNEEGIPVHRGIGVRDVREVDLGTWDRMGGRGAFLRLDGLDDIKSLYVLEIPPQGALNPERHIYHEFYLVIEGRGTAETWGHGGSAQSFEWKPGSYFMIPPNVDHRLVNATNDRVLLLAATNLPPIINIFRNRNFIFGDEYMLSDFYDSDREFYRYDDKLYSAPVNKRAEARTNFYPDIVSCELPLDNQRAPGYRRIQPRWSGLEDMPYGNGFIAQYPPGRYSRAHLHGASAVIVCLRGRGYSLAWHQDYGMTPWKDGFSDKVKMIEYAPGGLVAAAPGGANWFHQHFGISREPFRVINFECGPGPTLNPHVPAGDEGARVVPVNLNFSQGGRSIGYAAEDPHVREMFEAALATEGLRSEMPESLYTTDR